jgi:hypothetical protein
MPSYDLPDIEISEEDKAAMAQWMYNELTTCESDRQSIVATWINVQKLYEQTSVPEKKDFPFPGAAHVMVPVIPTYVEQIHARLMNTVYSGDDVFTTKPTVEMLYPFVKAIKKWCNWMTENQLDLERVDYGLLLEYLKLGNMVGKTVYTKEVKTLQVWDPALNDFTPSVEIMKDNAEIIQVPINDFWFPMYARSLDEAQWKSHRFRVDWNMAKDRAFAGIYDEEALKSVVNWYESHKDDYEEARTDLTQSRTAKLLEYEFHEVWFRYPLKKKPTVKGGDNNSLPIDEIDNTANFAPVVDLVGVFHVRSRTWLRLQYNWFPLGLDPFEHMPYVGREQMILGIGVGEMGIPFQIEVSTMHNQRLDNATISNMSGYKYKADSSIPSDLALAPGKGVPCDDMDDIAPLILGQKYDSTIVEEKHTLSFLQERIGARELEADQAALSQGTATGAIALLAEKGRRLDSIVRNVRRFHKRLMIKVILLEQKYGDKEKLAKVLGEEGILVAQLLESIPPQMIWDGIGVELTATTSTTSKDMDRQAKLTLFNLLVQYYGQLGQYMAAAMQAPPQVQPVFLEIINGLSTLVKEILEDFNIRNKTEFLIDLSAAQNNANTAATTTPPGVVQGGGMGAVQPGASPPNGGAQA